MVRNVIKQNRLFKNIDDESLERMIVCSRAGLKKYKRGDVVFFQEEEARKLFVLLKGRVAIIKHLVSGRKNILYEIEEGQVFGEHYFFGENQIYKYGAQAVTDIEIMEIPWEFFYCFCNDACSHHRQLIQNMLEILSMKEWLTIKKLNIVSSSSLKERISTWLMDEMDENNVVALRMNREELADYLGVARPSLSRSLMKMQDDGMIKVDKDKIHILNREKIENLCN